MGRFISADTYAATGQGLLGNNMFSYSLNNPVNMVDHSGNTPGAIAAIAGYALILICGVFSLDIIMSPQFQESLHQVITDISQQSSAFFDDLEKIITEKMAGSLAKSETRKTEQIHKHHIVAEKDPRAAISREILEFLFEDGVNDPRNLIPVNSRIHSRLHTNSYFMLVELVVVNAFLSAEPNRSTQESSVEFALLQLRALIGTLSELS